MSKWLKLFGTVLFLCSLMSQVSVANDAVLRFSWWGGDSRHKPTLEVIKLFESKNPGVKISGEYMGWTGYPERLTTQISGGNEPDIMQINWAWITTMYSKNGDGFYDLYKVRNNIRLEAFGDAIKTGVVNGKLNAIPISYTARVYLWQKSVLDKAGTGMPKTWDELFAMGNLFKTKLGKDYYPVDGQLYDVILMAHAYIVQKYGKQWIDPNQPKVALNKAEALEFVKFYKRFAETHTVIPLQTRLSIAGPEAPTEQQQEWINGKWAGNYVWDSAFVTRENPLPKTTICDVGEFLSMKGAKSSGYFGRPSMMYAVSRKSKNPVLAAKFIDFMLNDPAAIMILGDSRGVPMSSIGYNTLVKENKFNAVDKKAIDQIRKAKIDIPSPYFEHNRIQELVRSIFEGVSLGQVSDEEAANRLINETNQVLRSLK